MLHGFSSNPAFSAAVTRSSNPTFDAAVASGAILAARRRDAPRVEAGEHKPRKRQRVPASTSLQNPKKRHWTPEQDWALLQAMSQIVPHRWKLIAEHVPGRDHIQCLQRWQKVLDPTLVKGFWTKQEDSIVIKLRALGVTSWVEISRAVTGRNPKQCRERWNNYLDPDLNQGPWTKEEDEILVRGYEKHGSSWSEIAKTLPGRNQTKVRDRWKAVWNRRRREAK